MPHRDSKKPRKCSSEHEHDYNKSNSDEFRFNAIQQSIDSTDTVAKIIKKPYIKYKTPKQEQLANLIKDNQITFISGYAGTGKSYLPMYMAMRLMYSGEYDNLVVIKPAVSLIGEDLGYLKGSADEKIAAYAYSSIDNLSKIVGYDACDMLLEKKIVKPTPLSFIRGCTFGEKTIVILDEAQNTTKEQMKTFLSRLGEGCKMLVNGDVTQSDRQFNDKYKESGLADAINRLQGIDDIAFIEFGIEDIVRSEMIKKILSRYEDPELTE